MFISDNDKHIIRNINISILILTKKPVFVRISLKDIPFPKTQVRFKERNNRVIVVNQSQSQNETFLSIVDAKPCL